MKTKTAGTIALAFFAAAFLFHFTAKKQPTGKETGMFDELRQPASWQGKPSPDLTLDLLGNEKFVLSDHVGKEVIVLNFFATWCDPCKEEMPELVRFSEKHRNEPLIMIGVDADEREEAVREFMKSYNVTYPVAIDKSAAQKAFGVRSYPTTIFIGADGIIHLYEIGPIANADVALEGLYQTSLAQIRSGKGITKEAFLQLKAAGSGIESAATMTTEGKKRDPEDDVPPGRALDIAKKMSCPCGCTHTLMECTCGTSKKIKAKLKSADWGGKTDEEAIKSLNKEFCMK